MGSKKTSSMKKVPVNIVGSGAGRFTDLCLQEVNCGDKLTIVVGEEEKDKLDFIVEIPAVAHPRGLDKSLRGTLPGWKFARDFGQKRLRFLIAGVIPRNYISNSWFPELIVARLITGWCPVIWVDQIGYDLNRVKVFSPIRNIIA